MRGFKYINNVEAAFWRKGNSPRVAFSLSSLSGKNSAFLKAKGRFPLAKAMLSGGGIDFGNFVR